MKEDHVVHDIEYIYDTRIIARHIRDGEVDSKEYNKYLSSLPDEESRVRYIDVYHEEDEIIEEATPMADSLTFT